jgi:DNA-directed RNA polymerase subunit RPC12/RpoP
MKYRQLLILIGVAAVLAVIWLMRGGSALFATPKNERQLICSVADCANEFKTELPVKFQDYPVKCPKCAQRTAFVLTRCWRCNAAYALDMKHQLDKCPKCGCELPRY